VKRIRHGRSPFASSLTASGLGGALAVCAALLAACGPSDEGSRAKDEGRAKPISQVLKLSVVTAPGAVTFDKERLSAKAGRIAFELTNGKRKGHNIRIHTDDTCCFRPGSRDIGGTRTIGTGRTRVVLDLKPGIYTYLCATGGYWRTQHGTLVVR
jgi:plastocyanin